MRAAHAPTALAVALAVLAPWQRGRADDTASPPLPTAPAGPTFPPPPSPPTLSDAEILGAQDRGFHIDSITTRITGFDQFGNGYQAQGGPTPVSPGSERATILEPQADIEATQGDRWTHSVRVPVDLVSNASPHAVDVTSNASKHVESGSIDWAADYKLSPVADVALLGGVHLENPFRSWHGGIVRKRSFADGDTVLSASFVEVFDWFDRFDIHGGRHGRTDRSSTTGSVGVTQILTPTTLVNVNYGFTMQAGEMGNTWNSVPVSPETRGPEILPNERARHAVVARVAQFLPWDGALHLYYRFYADDWGLVAHSAEGELLQRISRSLYVGGHYRYHTQNGAYFFTTLAAPDGALRTADSDLAPFHAQTLGGKVVIDAPGNRDIRALHFEVGFDRYFRSNDLQVNVVTCATGYRF
jgi:hypothetical protein